mmetsp:Transcript_41871/g.126497  ORF Transcript_41871/g.126497 Transcript_41871/m.126497 type:complete len:225 (+) Transcript_41871:276-950(+)
MSASHSSTKAHGNFDKLFVFVGTMSPILRSNTSAISSSASPHKPRLESRMASPSTVSNDGFGSGSGQRFSNNQHNLSCSARSVALMMPNFSAAYALESIPYVTPSPCGTTPSPYAFSIAWETVCPYSKIMPLVFSYASSFRTVILASMPKASNVESVLSSIVNSSPEPPDSLLMRSRLMASLKPCACLPPNRAAFLASSPMPEKSSPRGNVLQKPTSMRIFSGA